MENGYYLIADSAPPLDPDCSSYLLRPRESADSTTDRDDGFRFHDSRFAEQGACPDTEQARDQNQLETIDNR